MLVHRQVLNYSIQDLKHIKKSLEYATAEIENIHNISSDTDKPAQHIKTLKDLIYDINSVLSRVLHKPIKQL
jgi:hypothetical protein